MPNIRDSFVRVSQIARIDAGLGKLRRVHLLLLLLQIIMQFRTVSSLNQFPSIANCIYSYSLLVLDTSIMCIYLQNRNCQEILLQQFHGFLSLATAQNCKVFHGGSVSRRRRGMGGNAPLFSLSEISSKACISTCT